MAIAFRGVLFGEWKWYPICNACSIFNTCHKDVSTKLLGRAFITVLFQWHNVRHDMFKNNSYKVVLNKQFMTWHQQVLFQWVEMTPLFNACHELLRTHLIKMFNKLLARCVQQCYFQEWRWYPLYNACSELFKNTFF